MSKYITREVALQTCRKMRNFYLSLKQVYGESGLSIESDRGRRNIMMSGPMERFLTDSLLEAGITAHHNGATGQPDVVLEVDGDFLEIECKLTSPHASSNSITFQTDFATLEKKGSLDFCYIIANPTFDGFVFLYFQGLTIDDFRKLSPGARGKVQMYKYKGLNKATPLMGEIINRKAVHLQKLSQAQSKILNDAQNYTEDVKSMMSTVKNNKKEKMVADLIKNGREAQIEINKIQDRINIVNERNASYSFSFEEIK